ALQRKKTLRSQSIQLIHLQRTQFPVCSHTLSPVISLCPWRRTLRMDSISNNCRSHNGWCNCTAAHEAMQSRDDDMMPIDFKKPSQRATCITSTEPICSKCHESLLHIGTNELGICDYIVRGSNYGIGFLQASGYIALPSGIFRMQSVITLNL